MKSTPEIIMCFPGKMKQCMRLIAMQYLQGTNIRPHYLPYISCIGQNDGVSQKELNEMIPVDKSHVSTVVRELMDLGLVYNSGTGKVHSLHLTDSGRNIMATSQMMFDIVESKMFKDLSDEEMEQFDRIIKVIDARVDALIYELGGHQDNS